MPSEQTADQPAPPFGAFDTDTAEWIEGLRATGEQRELTLARLHKILVQVARKEVHRRNSRLRLAGPELDDIAYHAAADALLAVTSKLDGFRGDSKFTTWACKFAILEVSAKIGRHHWNQPIEPMTDEGWERLPDRLGVDPADQAGWGELVSALRLAVKRDLTDHQRRVFVAIVVEGVPLDALAVRLSSNRNAIYKTMFDARRKLRASLVASGHLDQAISSRAGAHG